MEDVKSGQFQHHILYLEVFCEISETVRMWLYMSNIQGHQEGEYFRSHISYKNKWSEIFDPVLTPPSSRYDLVYLYSCAGKGKASGSGIFQQIYKYINRIAVFSHLSETVSWSRYTYKKPPESEGIKLSDSSYFVVSVAMCLKVNNQAYNLIDRKFWTFHYYH